jgi:hypothetical protein
MFPLHLSLKIGPLCPIFYTKLQEPCSFSRVPDGPYTWFPDILRVQKEGTQKCMSEWRQGLTLTQNVSSSAPHFLQVGLSLSPIIYKCLLKVLCPVRGPITTLGCVLLKDNNWTLVATSGSEINSRACLYVLQGPHNNTRCCFSIQCFIFYIPQSTHEFVN